MPVHGGMQHHLKVSLDEADLVAADNDGATRALKEDDA